MLLARKQKRNARALPRSKGRSRSRSCSARSRTPTTSPNSTTSASRGVQALAEPVACTFGGKRQPAKDLDSCLSLASAGSLWRRVSHAYHPLRLSTMDIPELVPLETGTAAQPAPSKIHWPGLGELHTRYRTDFAYIMRHDRGRQRQAARVRSSYRRRKPSGSRDGRPPFCGVVVGSPSEVARSSTSADTALSTSARRAARRPSLLVEASCFAGEP